MNILHALMQEQLSVDLIDITLAVIDKLPVSYLSQAVMNGQLRDLTPLHMAATSRDVADRRHEVIHRLAARGADLEARDRNDKTPFLTAGGAGYKNGAHALVEAKCDFLATRCGGRNFADECKACNAKLGVWWTDFTGQASSGIPAPAICVNKRATPNAKQLARREEQWSRPGQVRDNQMKGKNPISSRRQDERRACSQTERSQERGPQERRPQERGSARSEGRRWEDQVQSDDNSHDYNRRTGQHANEPAYVPVPKPRGRGRGTGTARHTQPPRHAHNRYNDYYDEVNRSMQDFDNRSSPSPRTHERRRDEQVNRRTESPAPRRRQQPSLSSQTRTPTVGSSGESPPQSPSPTGLPRSTHSASSNQHWKPSMPRQHHDQRQRDNSSARPTDDRHHDSTRGYWEQSEYWEQSGVFSDEQNRRYRERRDDKDLHEGLGLQPGKQHRSLSQAYELATRPRHDKGKSEWSHWSASQNRGWSGCQHRQQPEYKDSRRSYDQQARGTEDVRIIDRQAATDRKETGKEAYHRARQPDTPSYESSEVSYSQSSTAKGSHRLWDTSDSESDRRKYAKSQKSRSQLLPDPGTEFSHRTYEGYGEDSSRGS